MKISLFVILFIWLTSNAKCQSDSSFSDIKDCIVKENIFPDGKNPNTILVTSLFEKNLIGVYAFRKKGPHQLNRLAIKENQACRLISNDSSSTFIRKEINDFATKNKLNAKERKELQQKVQGFIIDFKESDYIK